jgi:long-chain acyl-CoA synthetase
MSKQTENLNQALLAAMDRYAGRTCFWMKRAGQFEATTYSDFQSRAFRLASFFRRQEILPGERIAIIANNSVEWMVAYVACLLNRGVTVPLRPFLPPKMLRFRLKDSGACLVVVQGKDQLQMIAEAGDGLPELRSVITIEAQPAGFQPGVKLLADLLVEPARPAEEMFIRAQAEEIEPDTLAAIHYTGGTLGKPKGAMFTHAQRLAGLQQMADWQPGYQFALLFVRCSQCPGRERPNLF